MMGLWNNSSTKIFKYPSDIGADESDTQNFVLFYAKPGGPRNRQTQGLGRNSSLIALHIPPGALQTNFQGNYETMVGGRVFEEGGVNLATVAAGAGLPIFSECQSNCCGNRFSWVVLQ